MGRLGAGSGLHSVREGAGRARAAAIREPGVVLRVEHVLSVGDSVGRRVGASGAGSSWGGVWGELGGLAGAADARPIDAAHFGAVPIVRAAASGDAGVAAGGALLPGPARLLRVARGGRARAAHTESAWSPHTPRIARARGRPGWPPGRARHANFFPGGGGLADRVKPAVRASPALAPGAGRRLPAGPKVSVDADARQHQEKEGPHDRQSDGPARKPSLFWSRGRGRRAGGRQGG